MHLVPVETIERDGVTMLRLPEHDWRARDGFALTDAGMNRAAGAGPDELLHLVPRAGQGFLLQGPEGPQDRRVPEIAVRRDAGRLPAGREDQRDAHAARAGQRARRLRHHRHRQPDDGGDRASHLQRLHEGLHLPEAGAGRHSAGRDARAEGRAGAALGFRDLRAADALESARHPPPAAAAGQRAQGADRRTRARPASPWRIT